MSGIKKNYPVIEGLFQKPLHKDPVFYQPVTNKLVLVYLAVIKEEKACKNCRSIINPISVWKLGGGFNFFFIFNSI